MSCGQRRVKPLRNKARDGQVAENDRKTTFFPCAFLCVDLNTASPRRRGGNEALDWLEMRLAARQGIVAVLDFCLLAL
jgi:hypothetical protein